MERSRTSFFIEPFYFSFCNIVANCMLPSHSEVYDCMY